MLNYRDSVVTISQDCFSTNFQSFKIVLVPKRVSIRSRILKNSFSGFRIPVLAAKWVSRQEGIVNNPLTIPLFQFISKLLKILPSM